MTSHCGKSARTNFFFGFSFASFFLLLLSSIIYGVWANRVPSTESTKGAAIFGACDLEGAIEVLFFWTMMMFSSTFFIFLFCWCSPSFSAVLFPGWRFHRRTKRGLFASFFFQETVLSIVIAITRARSFFFLWTDWKFPAPFPFPLRSAALVWSITANQRPNWIQSNENIRMLWAVFTRISLVTKQRGRSNMKRVFLL